MTDGEIKESLAAEGGLRIRNFSESSLQAASYDMRIGYRLLISSDETEIDLSKRTSATLAPGVFALVTTQESVELPDNIAGHIGVKSYYTRKGLVMLTGLQIDPGFQGVLVIGLYNASPRSLTLEYLAPFCTVEFHKLARPAQSPYKPGPEQKEGQIPRADKDYLRTLETQSLSEMSESLRNLTVDVGSLASSMKTMQYTVTIGLALVAILVAVARWFPVVTAK
jgi:deoxycytidine triphosphate deaminase